MQGANSLSLPVDRSQRVACEAPLTGMIISGVSSVVRFPRGDIPYRPMRVVG
jgi:hypothetical protein